MDSETVVITIKGVKHYFNGDELISPMQEAILFMNELAKKEELF